MFCSACGHSNAAGSMSCGKCGSPLAMVAAPAGSSQLGSVTPPATSAATQGANSPALATGSALAGIGDRAIAALLDIVVAASPFAVIGMWAAVRWGGVTPNGFQLQGTAAAITISLVVILWFLYVWLLEGLLGATLGKFILNLRVRRLDGSDIGLSKSLVRNLSRVVDAIGVYLVGFLIANFSNRKQRLGDHLAGTVVVHVDSGKVTRAIAAVAWAAIIIACFVKAYALHPSGTSGQGASLPLAQSTPQTSPVIAPAQTAPMQTPSSAPSSAAVGGQVTRAEMGTGKTDDYKIVNPSVEFYVDTPEIVCVWDVAGVDPSVPIKSVWVADDVGAAAPPHLKLIEKSVAGYSEGSFSVTRPDHGWPAGQYHLEIYIGDTLAKQIPFSIKQR
jgi:uncharacterized RDD family membrane protein YckC